MCACVCVCAYVGCSGGLCGRVPSQAIAGAASRACMLPSILRPSRDPCHVLPPGRGACTLARESRLGSGAKWSGHGVAESLRGCTGGFRGGAGAGSSGCDAAGRKRLRAAERSAARQAQGVAVGCDRGRPAPGHVTCRLPCSLLPSSPLRTLTPPPLPCAPSSPLSRHFSTGIPPFFAPHTRASLDARAHVEVEVELPRAADHTHCSLRRPRFTRQD